MDETSKARHVVHLHDGRMNHLIDIRTKYAHTVGACPSDAGVAVLGALDEAIAKEAERFIRAYRALGNERLAEIRKVCA